MLSYHRTLVSKTPKSGKWADLSSCLTRLLTSPTVLVATNATQGTPVSVTVSAPTVSSLVLPLLSLGVSNLGIHYNRKKIIKIVRVLDVYHQNKANKVKIKENLLEAAFEIFKNFEIKFKQATVYGSYELALYKLARDAVDRIFNFFKKKLYSLELDENFFSSTNITKAFILGKSKRYRNMFSIPHRYLGLRLDGGLSTKRLYEETPILKIVSENESYCYKKNKARDIADFRLLFPCEEEKEAVDSPPPVQWGSDEIILFEKRVFQKITDFSRDESPKLKLAKLTDKEFQDIQSKILDEINSSHGNSEGFLKLEDVLKRELTVMELTIKDEFRREINKLEENMTDLRNVILPLVESFMKKSEASGIKPTGINIDDDEVLNAPFLAKGLEKAHFYSPSLVSSQGLSEEARISPTRSLSPHRSTGSSFFEKDNHALQTRRRSSQNMDTFEEEGFSLRSHTSSLESEQEKQSIRPRQQSPQGQSKLFFTQKAAQSSYVSSMLDNSEDVVDYVANVLDTAP